MPQTTDWSANNASGGVVRAQLNEIFAAIQSSSQGTGAPSPTVAGMFWLDTGVSPAVMRQRNTANTAWIVVTPETIAANSFWGNPTGGAAALQAVTTAQAKTMLGYSQLLAANGYQVLPSGLIVQWGSGASGAAGVTVTFPLAFPALSRLVLGANATSSAMVTFQSLGLTSAYVQGWASGGGAANVGFNWLAIGY